MVAAPAREQGGKDRPVVAGAKPRLLQADDIVLTFELLKDVEHMALPGQRTCIGSVVGQRVNVSSGEAGSREGGG